MYDVDTDASCAWFDTAEPLNQGSRTRTLELQIHHAVHGRCTVHALYEENAASGLLGAHMDASARSAQVNQLLKRAEPSTVVTVSFPIVNMSEQQLYAQNLPASQRTGPHHIQVLYTLVKQCEVRQEVGTGTWGGARGGGCSGGGVLGGGVLTRYPLIQALTRQKASTVSWKSSALLWVARKRRLRGSTLRVSAMAATRQPPSVTVTLHARSESRFCVKHAGHSACTVRVKIWVWYHSLQRRQECCIGQWSTHLVHSNFRCSG